jgi:aarF domain-containing kinase
MSSLLAHRTGVQTGLAAGLGLGAVSEALRRSTSGSDTESDGRSLLLSSGNVNRLVDRLSKMRGAALKLGQFMSIQGETLSLQSSSGTLTDEAIHVDSHMLPEQLDGILRKVQASAHYMPNWQMEVCIYSGRAA